MVRGAAFSLAVRFLRARPIVRRGRTYKHCPALTFTSGPGFFFASHRLNDLNYFDDLLRAIHFTPLSILEQLSKATKTLRLNDGLCAGYNWPSVAIFPLHFARRAHTQTIGSGGDDSNPPSNVSSIRLCLTGTTFSQNHLPTLRRALVNPRLALRTLLNVRGQCAHRLRRPVVTGD